MKALIAKLVWPAYLVAIVFGAYTGVNSYLDASFIMKDHTVIGAPIDLVDTTSRTRRGHTSTTYIFNYTYTVDGREFESEYSAVNDKGKRYLDEPLITLAYSNTDPAKVGALHVVERQSSLGGLIKRVLMFAFIVGLLALFVYGWAATGKEDESPSEGVDPLEQPQA